MTDSTRLITHHIRAHATYADGQSYVELDIFVYGGSFGTALRLHVHVPVDQAIKLVGEIDDAIADIKEPRDG